MLMCGVAEVMLEVMFPECKSNALSGYPRPSCWVLRPLHVAQVVLWVSAVGLMDGVFTTLTTPSISFGGPRRH